MNSVDPDLPIDRPRRVMWLLNHSTARRFDVAMLRRIGVSEIFLPKSFPDEISFRSASVDHSLDATLSIPAEDLAILNAADWHRCPGREAWEVANRHFDILFFMAHHLEMLEEVSAHFRGIAIWRAFGLDVSLTYTRLISYGSGGLASLERMGRRFRFGAAYAHLPQVEGGFIQDHAVYLPLGLDDPEPRTEAWHGSDQTVFFVCPELGFNPYYRDIYERFISDFGDLPHKIGGAQPIVVDDPDVLGYVESAVYERNMREFRVMFYHSREPNHVHYHPFEAVRAGMPLVFMSGGLLDRLGGLGLPGRCETVAQARGKLQALLAGDTALSERIRSSQVRLLDAMRPDHCEPFWREGFRRILDEMDAERRARAARPPVAVQRKRIAVIMPLAYGGGTLRAAKLVAEAVWRGSEEWGEAVDVVFAYPDDARYSDESLEDLPAEIARRSFAWTTLGAQTAQRAMHLGGHAWQPSYPWYLVPDDGMQRFGDCDLWLFVSDRVSQPLLPLRPYVTMVFDYIQRYVEVVDAGASAAFIRFANEAKRVLVTTRFTEADALQYAGIPARKLCRVPMLVPSMTLPEVLRCCEEEAPYFLWTTNATPHKNQVNALRALQIYYNELGGGLRCKVTGVNTRDLLDRYADAGQSSALGERLALPGELNDHEYRATLAGAAFLWHPALVDNGTLSVVEAAQLGVPALSSDYPAMREIDAQFGLNLEWMDVRSPRGMAERLRWMEDHHRESASRLPGAGRLSQQALPELAGEYWRVLRECL